MHIEKAIFINRAPFTHLELDFKSQGVNVLTAINGKGKTTILSHIVDAFHEIAKATFSYSFEGNKNKYYRVSTSIYSLNRSEPSFAYLRFRDGETHHDYVDICGQCSAEQYDAAITIENKIPFSELQPSLQQLNHAKRCASAFDEKKKKDVFQNNVLTYFPAYRYEQPGYLNAPYKINLKFRLDSKVAGELPNHIEVISDLQDCANWLMDLVLDIRQYPTNANHTLFALANEVMSSALISKHPNIGIGIGPRTDGSERLALTDVNTQNPVFPSIFNLSSGELSIICIFCELLRQADRISKLSGVSGIVLIDEVDKHLHIKLQKEILPKMFALFPNIQFIVSSHSPFLNMGLAEELPERSHVIDLDNNGIICSPTNNELYAEVYNMMVSENEQFAKKYQELETKIASSTKPLIITEGKTDIKHIQKAKERLGITDVDFECIDTATQPEGWDDLEKCLKQLGRIKHAHKIIGIYDHDVNDIVKRVEKNGQQCCDYGNGVYGFCITSPESRAAKNQTKISIEYLYSDDEIKTPLENGRRLFFGTEFDAKTSWHTTQTWTLKMPDGIGKDKILESNKGQAVCDKDGNNKLATKNDFAEAVSNGTITISQESWENFLPLFDRIKAILNLGQE